MAMEVNIRASWWVVRGPKLKTGLCLPPIRAYMDDITKTCSKRLLNKLQENIQWARMQIKPRGAFEIQRSLPDLVTGRKWTPTAAIQQLC